LVIDVVFLVSQIFTSDAVFAVLTMIEEKGILAVVGVLAPRAVVAIIAVDALVQQFPTHTTIAIRSIDQLAAMVCVIGIYAIHTCMNHVAILISATVCGELTIFIRDIPLQPPARNSKKKIVELIEKGARKIIGPAVVQGIPSAIEIHIFGIDDMRGI
jgi:hypothetical protein